MVITCSACRGPCQSPGRNSYKPVIAIAGLSCETSTFTHARTDLPDFESLRGNSIVDEHEFLHEGTDLGDAAVWRGALSTYAIPGGIVTRSAFEELANEIVSRLERIVNETFLDGLWYDIHGAMCVEGIEDSEVELLQRIRRVVGCDVAVSASLDLHGNVSRDLVEQVDLITCYRSAPHEDVGETKERACQNLVDLLRDRRRYEEETTLEAPWPLKAWVPIPILLPGEQTSTRQEPAKTIYSNVRNVASRKGLIDASAWVGYAWADEQRSRASIVVTGWHKSTVSKAAEELAKLFWNSRRGFHFAAPAAPFDDCFKKAVQSKVQPYFISDSGDNPTAGGSGDVTWTLRRLIHLLGQSENAAAKRFGFVYASLPSPDAVARAVEAGLNADVTVDVDAGVDDEVSTPITLSGFVHAIKHGDPAAETEVVLALADLPILVILTKRRKPFHFEHDFTDLNLFIVDKRHHVIVVIKIGYLEPELYALAQDWMLALTPGGVDQDLPRLGHKNIERPMWPLDKDFKEQPDLTARIMGRECKALVEQSK